MHRDNCKGCGAPILWVRTSSGKFMPCEVGVLVIVDDAGHVHRGHESHYAHCPKAKDFRRRGPMNPPYRAPAAEVQP